MKISSALAATVLLGASLGACSGGDGGNDAGDADSSYCKALTAAKPTLDTLSSGDLGQLEQGFTTFHELADEAPGSLESQWKILDDAATDIETALKDAGLSFDDLPAIQTGDIPEGVDVAKLTAFAADLQKLNNQKFTEARADIAEQAKDVCGVDLGTS